MKKTLVILLALLIIVSCKKNSKGEKWGSTISKSEWLDRAVNSDNSLLISKFGDPAKDKEKLKKYYSCWWDKATEYLERNIPEDKIVEGVNYRKDSIPDIIFSEIVVKCGSENFVYTKEEQQREIQKVISSMTPGMYPELSERRIKDSEIQGASKHDLRLMRNEIFARHGYIFKSPDLREYFSGYDWYKPRYDNVEDRLSEIEKYNIELIKKYER